MRDSVANDVMGAGSETVSFTCPAVRDTAIAGLGGYSVYLARSAPSLEGGPVSCTAF